jgi:hypothetical protein
MTIHCPATRKTRQILLRVSVQEFDALREISEVAGVSVSEFLRRSAFGRRIVPRRDVTRMINEIRRQGGLMKYLSFRGHSIDHVALDVLAIAVRMEAFVDALNDTPRGDGS